MKMIRTDKVELTVNNSYQLQWLISYLDPFQWNNYRGSDYYNDYQFALLEKYAKGK